jgi:hypothetical protein
VRTQRGENRGSEDERTRREENRGSEDLRTRRGRTKALKTRGLNSRGKSLGEQKGRRKGESGREPCTRNTRKIFMPSLLFP